MAKEAQKPETEQTPALPEELKRQIVVQAAINQIEQILRDAGLKLSVRHEIIIEDVQKKPEVNNEKK